MIFPESPPPAVTPAYALGDVVWTPLGAAGGFSGSRIWRGLTPDGRAFCLKTYPPGRVDRATLQGTVHRWMRAAPLPFVPRLAHTLNGETAIECDGRVWDLTDWMPGVADFDADPSDARLAAAVTALAELHRTWARSAVMLQPAPAVARRVAALTDWVHLAQSGWRPRFGSFDGSVREPAERAWNMLPALVRQAAQTLEPWRFVPVPTHPCMCDVWHDHVLFTGDLVTGLVDYGAAKIDNPGVDLARLLGSLVPDDPARTSLALKVYQQLVPLSHPQLVSVLDRTGTVVAAIHWLRSVYHDRKRFEDMDAIARRLSAIVQRFVRWG